MEEFTNDKQKLEEKMLELLKDFNKKYPEVIIKDVNLLHRFERNFQGQIATNEIAKIALDLKI